MKESDRAPLELCRARRAWEGVTMVAMVVSVTLIRFCLVVVQHLGDHGEDEEEEGGHQVAGGPPVRVVDVEPLGVPGGHHQPAPLPT